MRGTLFLILLFLLRILFCLTKIFVPVLQPWYIVKVCYVCFLWLYLLLLFIFDFGISLHMSSVSCSHVLVVNKIF